MPLQKSFSESRPTKPYGNRPWQRSKSYSYGPKPPPYPQLPPPPPPPPVEISKNTKSKLKKFQFQPPAVVVDDDSPELRQDTAVCEEPEMPRQKSQKSQKSQRSQRSQRKEQQNEPAATIDDPPAMTSNDDQETNAPSTQPNKTTTPSVAATPEFLSIHIGTPRARFAWQELAGTPDAPKITEPLGISPNAQLSWVTDRVHLPPPVAPRPGKKRARSSSPPSSPSNNKSKMAALNVERFKEVLKTALANPTPPVRNRLSRHHTALGSSERVAAPLDADDPQATHDGQSPRGAPSFRRAMSCGNPAPKRRRAVEGESRRPLSRTPDRHQAAAQPRAEPSAARQESADKSFNSTLADTESMGQPAPPPPETKDAGSFSDYGDDFDDDMLAEIDASLAPAPMAEPDMKPEPIPGDAPQDEFDDLDDVFADAEDLMAEIENQPASAPVPSPPPAVGDVEDAYGDDFGADFDFDAAEKAATQAVGNAAPWANVSNAGPKARVIQRYLVTSVIPASYTDGSQRTLQEKVLILQGEQTGSARTVHLRGDWVDTPVNVKAFVHVLGEFDRSGVCVVDNDHHMLILHPDQLVSSTVVADSFTCTRRAVLQDRVKATSDPSSALVYGTLLHEIFQDALMANQWSRAYLAGAVDRSIQKHLEELYTIKVETGVAREHLLTKTGELACWADLFLAEQPKPDAIVQGRHGEKVRMSISKLLDVEEHVWSPLYGLKGNIDATVQVTMETGKDGSCSTLTVPFELKTGRNMSTSHQAQTVLYNLLLSDRYDIEIVYGILYYMESSQMLRVPAIRHELRHMVMQRNGLACYIRERSVQLPPMLKSRNACGRCYAQSACFVYHKLADGGDGATSGMGDKFDEAVRHLTPTHRAFFLKWEDLLTKEEKVSHRLRRELWTMVSAEREKLGRCFGNVVLEPGSASEDRDSPKINRFHYTLIKESASADFSFMDSQLAVGEPIVVSDEEGHFALALGYVTAVRRQRIKVAVDRRLHNVRVRQPGFDEKTNQVFAGIMEVGRTAATGATGATEAREEPKKSEDPVRYRLDKDEFSNGMAVVRNNLVQIMAGEQAGAHEIRQLVVDLVPPRFKTVSTQYRIDGSAPTAAERLNVDQKAAIDKVMSARDYALVLGMPGTGKTTTIAHIIRALVRQGKSVLLTSYTHTAVDNILLKLRGDDTPVLRLGAPAKVHPEVRAFAVLAGEPQASFEAIRQAWHGTPVVATTCLGIGHAVFRERTFDYCIVDEASQITLPICLGPIRMARTFVLVGDHNQLPPLVQNEEARAGGLDVSLFKLLSDTHPQSVVNLEHQYRMCEDIMTLSNTLIYNGRLKCGYEALRFRSLAVPDLDALRQHHHTPPSVARPGGPRSFCAAAADGGSCWLRDLVRPETRVAFVNTDGIEGSREAAKGNRIVNPCEARVVTQLVEALLTVGVPASEIGVMTHYRSQLALLKHELRGVLSTVRGGGASIEMHTADRFQGRDKEVIVLSLVRSNEACSIGDLLRDWRRINVAFTRAKTKLLVIGSRSTLKGQTGDHEEMLARFVSLMEERAWIYDLPADALGSHVFEDVPTTQAASLALSEASPKAERRTQPAKTRVPLSEKENRQPLKRARVGDGVLKGRPVLKGILEELMGGPFG